MIRGINVGGHKTIRMGQLRELFAALGFEQVRTYLQSGNLVFKADAGKGSSSGLSRKIEEEILRKFGLAVAVIVKFPEDIRASIRRNPFLKQNRIDKSKLHVTFLVQVPRKASLKSLNALTTGTDQFRYSGKEIYLYCPNGYGTTRLSNSVLEKLLSVRATTRNWRTVNKLCELAFACK